MPVEYDEEANELRASRRLRKSGNSVVVSMPPEILRNARLKVGDEIVVAGDFSSGEIQLRKAESGSAEQEAQAEN